MLYIYLLEGREDVAVILVVYVATSGVCRQGGLTALLFRTCCDICWVAVMFLGD